MDLLAGTEWETTIVAITSPSLLTLYFSRRSQIIFCTFHLNFSVTFLSIEFLLSLCTQKSQKTYTLK